MYKVRRIGKFAEQSGPRQLLRADTRRRENDEKKKKNTSRRCSRQVFTRPRKLLNGNTIGIKMHASRQLIDELKLGLFRENGIARSNGEAKFNLIDLARASGVDRNEICKRKRDDSRHR